MQDEVIVRYQFGDGQMKEITSNVVGQKWVLYFAAPLGLVAFIIPALREFWAGAEAYDIAASLLPRFLLGVFFILMIPIVRWLTLRQLRRSLVRNVWVTWRITPERLF